MVNPAQNLENIPQKQIIRENPILDARERLYEIKEKHEQTLWLTIIILIVVGLLLGLGLFFYLKLTKKGLQPQIFLQQTSQNGTTISQTGTNLSSEGFCSSCLDARALQGHTPSASASAGKVPVLTDNGDLVLAGENPTLYSTLGSFGIKGQELTLTTDIGTDGSITLAPDGSGAVFLHLGGSGPEHLRITNANISTGALISAYGGNSLIGYDLLRLTSGVSETPRFTISSSGDMMLSRNASISGSLETSSLTVKGWLENLFSVKNTSGTELLAIKNNNKVGISQYLTILATKILFSILKMIV